MQLRYTATRNLIATHTVDTEYTVTAKLRDYDRSRQTFGTTVTSLSGREQTTHQRGDTLFKCATIPLTGNDAGIIREFLESVEDGTRFEFDGGGGFYLCTIQGSGYTEKRVVETGDVTTDYYSFGWTQRAE